MCQDFRRMKIAFIIPSIASYYAFLSELVLKLSEKNHVIVFTGANSGEFQWDSMNSMKVVQIAGLETISYSSLASILKLRKLIKAEDPDQLHFHFTLGALYSSFVFHPRKIITYHGRTGALMDGWKGKLIKGVERFSITKASQVQVLTASDRIEEFNDKIRVISSCGVGVRLERLPVLKPYKGRSKPITFAYLGRLTAFKGFIEAVEIVSRLRQQDSSIQLKVGGVVDAQHPIELPKEPWIEYVGWVNDIQSFYTSVDVLLFPSTREGMPVTLMESLCAGVYPIVLKARGSTEMMNKAGLPICDSTDEMIQQAREFIASPIFISQDQIAQFRELFDRRHFVEDQINFIQSLG